jgi:serine/threonine-protein kinase
MRKLGPMPLAMAKGFLSQACAAVAAAHTIGVVHRDLKPENMFLTRGEDGAEVLKVLDFGISKAMRATVADDQQKLTKTTDVFGSPTYMSPEQLKASRDVDGRADVWSLGVLLHEMLAGVPPFEGRSVAEIFGAILYKQPEPLSRIRPDIPPEVERAVQRALEKDREKRFASVDELYAAVMGKPGAVARAPEARASRPTVMIAAIALCAIAGLVSFLLARWLM